MPLEAKLEIAKTQLSHQESPACRIVISNPGKVPVQVMHPRFNANSPVFRVIAAKAGTEEKHQGKPRMSGPRWQPLAPGQSIDYSGPLLKFTGPLTPGEYDISAIVEYDGGDHRTESPSVRILVLPVSPRSLHMAFSTGGASLSAYGASMNAMEDPPRLLRYKFDWQLGGGVTDLTVGPPTTLRAEPVLSAPANQKATHSHWVAWLEDEELCFTHFDAALGQLETKKMKLPGLEVEIVRPLFVGEAPNEKTRPPAAAVLWMGTPGGPAAKLQVVTVSPAGLASMGSSAPLAGARPYWIMSHARSDGSRLITFVQKSDRGTALKAVPWHSELLKTSQPATLTMWGIDHVATGAVLTMENAVVGATLLRQPDDGVLKLAKWTIAPEGRFIPQPQTDVPWPPDKPIAQARVRVSPTKVVAAVIQDDTGAWSVFDGINLEPCPGQLATTSLPLEIAFLNHNQPILVAGMVGGGIDCLLPSGDPMPIRRK